MNACICLATAVALAAFGCGGDDSSSGTGGSAGSGASAGSSGSGGSGGASGAGGSAGADCNTIQNVATAVVPAQGNGALPTATGGAIADGTYVLTALDAYPPSVPETKARRLTIRFVGGVSQVRSQIGNEAEVSFTAAVTTSGTTLTSVLTCPSPQTIVDEYSATPTTLTVISAGQLNLVQTLQKI